VSDDAEQLARFEAWGTAEVRLLVESGRLNPSNERLAIKWLAQKYQEADRRNEASQAEQAAMARSAREAAWEAVRAAKTANRIAIIAVAIAIIAPIISFLIFSK
jgi:hypothetical protein